MHKFDIVAPTAEYTSLTSKSWQSIYWDPQRAGFDCNGSKDVTQKISKKPKYWRWLCRWGSKAVNMLTADRRKRLTAVLDGRTSGSSDRKSSNEPEKFFHGKLSPLCVTKFWKLHGCMRPIQTEGKVNNYQRKTSLRVILTNWLVHV